MVTLYAICHMPGCKNQGFEISKQAKSGYYPATEGRLKPRENIVCPGCRCWAKITRIEEVPHAS